jgi:hypothetical protein
MLKEVALSLVRAAAVARARGLHDDALRIERALATLLTVDTEDENTPTSSGAQTRLGIGPIERKAS